MSECTKRGCRTLETVCQDCDRVICTATRSESLDPNDWYDIDAFPPGHDEPIEYTISVTCKGWYKGDGKEHVIAPDELEAPLSKITSWRPLKDGQNWEDGRKAVLEFREKMIKES